MMNDLISRQALCEYALNQKDKSVTPNDIMRFPSAQADSKETSSTHKALDTISRQAAIDHLKKRLYETALNNNTEHPYYEEIADNRVDIWLNELPSAQPEKHTEERTETHSCDLIDRQAAIDATRNAKISFTIKSDIDFANYRKEMQEIFNNILDAQEKALNDLPPAQPERKKGKWIYGESEAGNDGYYCSKCGNFVPWKYDEYDIDFIKEFLFCNKCGADMREDGEADDRQ